MSILERPIPESPADDLPISRVRAARRRRILESAQQTFVRDGFRHATMERVADDAGVSKQTLYNYFSDKEELFASLLETQHVDRVVGEVEEALAAADGTSSRDALTAVAAAVFRYAAGPEMVVLHRLMVEVVGERPEVMDRLRRRFFYPTLQGVRAAFEQAAARSVLREADFEAIALSLFGIAASFAMLRPVSPDETLARLSGERMAAALGDLLERGLIAGSPRESS